MLGLRAKELGKGRSMGNRKLLHEKPVEEMSAASEQKGEREELREQELSSTPREDRQKHGQWKEMG